MDRLRDPPPHTGTWCGHEQGPFVTGSDRLSRRRRKVSGVEICLRGLPTFVKEGRSSVSDTVDDIKVSSDSATFPETGDYCYLLPTSLFPKGKTSVSLRPEFWTHPVYHPCQISLPSGFTGLLFSVPGGEETRPESVRSFWRGGVGWSTGRKGG